MRIPLAIRRETADDRPAVYGLIKAAFGTARRSDGNEQDLAESLRKNPEAFIPGLSLVAEEDGVLVGHILFTRMKVGSDTVLALAPLSVRLESRGRGIGRALIREGHRVAAELGYAYSVVVGDADYYAKSGYRPAGDFSIEIPEGVPAGNCMVAELIPGAAPLSGRLEYAPEFGMRTRDKPETR